MAKTIAAKKAQHINFIKGTFVNFTRKPAKKHRPKKRIEESIADSDSSRSSHEWCHSDHCWFSILVDECGMDPEEANCCLEANCG